VKASNIDGRKTILHSDKRLGLRTFKDRFKNSNDGKRELMVQLLGCLHCDVPNNGQHIRNTWRHRRPIDESVWNERLVMEENDARKSSVLRTYYFRTIGSKLKERCDNAEN